MTTKSLLLVDIQNDYFPNGAFPLPGMPPAAANAASLLCWARQQRLKIVHVRHEERDSSAGILLEGTTGSEIHVTTKPLATETTITKNYPNAFRDTNLAAVLEGTEELLIVGAMSNMCIDATARAAFDLGFKITIIEDACAASDLEFQGQSLTAAQVHRTFMAALASAYGEVVQTRDILRYNE